MRNFDGGLVQRRHQTGRHKVWRRKASLVLAHAAGAPSPAG